MERKDFDFKSQDENTASYVESGDTNDDSDSSEIPSESDENSSTSDVASETDSDNKGVEIKCNYCEKLFSVQRYLDAHIQSKHSERKAFNCDECNHSFTLKKNLKRHEEIIHGGKSQSAFIEPKVVTSVE